MMHEESEIINESGHRHILATANVKGGNRKSETLFYLTIGITIHSACFTWRQGA